MSGSVARGTSVLLMYEPGERHRRALTTAAPDARIHVARSEAEARELIDEAEAVIGNRFFLQSLPNARRLRWMQSNSVGLDRVLCAGRALDGIVVTSVRGVYDDEVADHAVALVLALARGLGPARDAQKERRWDRRPLQTLRDRSALILGFGGVGRAIASRLAAFGMRTEGARRGEGEAGPPFRVWGGSAWRDALPGVATLVLALPLTRETRHLVGAAELQRLPRGAHVINVGRGGTLDEGALVDALETGHLGGAALDVFEQEPLRTESALWDVPGLLVSPHVARSPEAPPRRWEPVAVENLRRFAHGETLLNVVDKERGY